MKKLVMIGISLIATIAAISQENTCDSDRLDQESGCESMSAENSHENDVSSED